MGQLDILSEEQSLIGGDVAVHLEHHHGQRTTRLHVTDDKFGNDVQSNLYISCGLDDTDRKIEEQRDKQSHYECPPGQVSLPHEAGHETKRKHDEKADGIPSIESEQV